jgi:choline dehydrogenase/5-(hydroxymethyl)furfural/furfural oxidase
MVSLMRPTSTGSLRLRSPDASDDPLLDLRLLADPGDLDRLGEAVRRAVDLLDHAELRGVVDGQPAWPRDDLGRWLLENCQSLYHPSGTCRMGRPDDAATVVDVEGRVLGVDGLWVADASVAPAPYGVPPYLSTVMVAERLGTALTRRLRPGR